MEELSNALQKQGSLQNVGSKTLNDLHPRYADYKNLGKHAEKQRLRREEYLIRILEYSFPKDISILFI
jgi:mRNA-degrading endonuclease RelE of RelBE toxin-antitoxin system